MAEQAWFSAGNPEEGRAGQYAVPPPPPKVASLAAYELRPLTTGEILDRTFHLYRSNFWLFVALASIAAAINVLSALGKLAYQHYLGTFVIDAVAGPMANSGGIARSAGFLVVSMLGSVLYFAAYGVTQAATTSAVTSIYLGDFTSMKVAYKAVVGRWPRFFGISLWQLWSAGWIFLALIIPAMVIYGLGIQSKMWLAGLLIFTAVFSMIYGMIAYIRNSFAVPAAVMEGLTVRKAMRRSKQLSAGSKWRIFLLFLFITMLYFVALAIQSPILILIAHAKSSQLLLSQAAGLFIGFFASAVIGPVGAIGFCLFYIDQRIRKEGFDIECLIERSVPPVTEPIIPLAVENP